MTDSVKKHGAEIRSEASLDASGDALLDSGKGSSSKRAHIPESSVVEVLLRSRRRCAMCYEFDDALDEVEGQIAHVDRDNSNAEIDNLAFLCERHHNKYDSYPSQAKRYLPAELKRWREKLYMELGTSKYTVSIKLNYSDANEAEVLRILSELKRVKGIVLGQFNSYISSYIAFLDCDDQNMQRLGDLLRDDPEWVASVLPERTELVIGNELKALSIAELAQEHVLVKEGIEETTDKKRIADWDKVIDIYKSAIAFAPRGAALWAKLGNALVQRYRLMGDVREGGQYLALARQSLENAIQYGEISNSMSNDAAAFASYAVVLFELEEFVDAERATEIAVERDPTLAHAWESRIIFLANRARHEEALRVSKQALASVPLEDQNGILELVQAVQLQLQELRRRG